jgi:hypothetical protein
VRNPRGCRDKAAGGNGDRLGLAPDLERQLALEDVERIRVLVMDVRAGYRLADRVSGVRDRDLIAGEEDADLALGGSQDRIAPGDRGLAFGREASACRLASISAGVR